MYEAIKSCRSRQWYRGLLVRLTNVGLLFQWMQMLLT